MANINSVNVTEFSFITPNIGLETAAAGAGNMSFVNGNIFETRRFAIKIEIDTGACGEYVTNSCVPVPTGPGLGVSYDWKFIAAHKTQQVLIN